MADLVDYCMPDDDYAPDWLTRPFRIGGWTCASDGKWFVARGCELNESNTLGERKEVMSLHRAAAYADLLTLSLPALRLWAGEYQPDTQEPCEDCPSVNCNTEQHENFDRCHNCCDECDNSRTIYNLAPDRPALLCGVNISRNRLARVLPWFGDHPTIGVGKASGPSGDMVALRQVDTSAPARWALLMSMNRAIAKPETEYVPA